MLAFLTIAAATLVSEDATCIAAGALIQHGALTSWVAVGACGVGIYIGDLLLYGAGRWLGDRLPAWARAQRDFAPPILLASRFVPGARLPLYLACGALKSSPAQFALWTLLAVLLWTPAIVLGAAGLLTMTTNPLFGVLSVLVAWRVASGLMTRRGRQRAIAALSRIWRWEFWPMWLFYAPVATWVVWLCFRYRGVAAIAAANPGIPDGGIVGESKHEILSHLPSQFTIPSALIARGTRESRVAQLVSQISSRGWEFPLVLKPDAGQRGAGVRLARTLDDAAEYLTQETQTVLVQPFHIGPYEAGIFYYRMPGSPRGRILSITDKRFPSVTGDGSSTVEDLIWGDARLRMQAETFLRRHADGRSRVLARGERLQLAIAGNHAQGTLFRDGRHLITTALEDRIDSIACAYRGFFIGRFDVRYSDVERFKAGEELAIVELNGATAESTNVYDPAGSLFNAYRQLFRQWSLVFAIGAANVRAGATSGSLARLFDLTRAHLTSHVAFPTSD
jgi:membrane protein DedA with SNARE-associated domain